MEENKKGYLNAILMRNKRGKSPIDITLDNESPKCTELLLKKLTLFQDSKLSSIFYDRFIELFSMNLKAFHQYLESCMFQTFQMKNTKHLKMKKDKDPLLIEHSSCIIDGIFIKNHCRNDEKIIQELEKAIKEQKEKEEKDRQVKRQKTADSHRKREEHKIKLEEDKQLNDQVFDKDHELNDNAIEDNQQSLLQPHYDTNKDGQDEPLLSKDELHPDSVFIEKQAKSKEELQLERIRKLQKQIEIKAIEFDWIFSKQEGFNFMKILSHSNDMDLFSLNIIKNIINFFWGYYRNAIIIYIFLPFIFYFILFILYTTYFQKRLEETDDARFERFGLAGFVSIIMLILFIIYNAFYEIMQVVDQKLAYFSTFWNLVDMTSLVLNTTILIMDLGGAKDQHLNTLMGIAVLFMWLKLFYFGRIFTKTAGIVRMILQISFDMKYFLLIFLLSCTGFGNAFFIMARNGEEPFTGDTFFRAFLYAYNLSLGEFNTDDFNSEDRLYLDILWFCNTLITLVVFLNLLIAIMGDTFDRVQETAESNMLKELASIMIENDTIINRGKVFKNSKYIIVVQEQKADQRDMNWEGRLKRLRDFMYESVETQSKLLTKLQHNCLGILKDKADRKAKEIDTSTSKTINSLANKLDIFEEMVGRYKVIFAPENEEEKDQQKS